jgi:hypothetical protein
MARLTVQSQIKPFKVIATRWLMTATLVFGTYNPSGRSYWHWVTTSPEMTPVQTLVGLFLLVSLVAVARMAYAALGLRGITVVLALIIASKLIEVGLGFSRFADMRVTDYTVLFWITTVLGFGVSWAILQKAITGERDIIRNPP